MIRTFDLKFILIIIIVFSWCYNAKSQDSLIRTGDEWLYYKELHAPDNGWTEQHHQSIEWKKGRTPIGFKYENLETELFWVDTMVEKIPIVTYFKFIVDIENVEDYVGFKIDFRRDDGAVIYINNQEVLRSNMSDELLDHKSNAESVIRREEEEYIVSNYLETNTFKKGANVIAISVHQLLGSSYDLILDFQLIGIKNPEMLNEFLKREVPDEINARIQIMDQKHELRVYEIQEEFNNRLIYIQWGLIFLGLIGLGGLVYYFNKANTLKNKETNDLKEEILTLTNKLISKDQNILNHSISGVRNSTFLKEIKQELLQVLHTDKVDRKEIQKLINKIDAQSTIDEEWEYMKYHFDAVFSGFNDRLSSRFPQLSQQEIRHCSFIRLHLETKEISNILRIDPKSVQAARYRIKKKMNLSESEDLKEVINLV